MTVYTPPPPGPGKRENRALPAMLLVVSLALLYILLPFYGDRGDLLLDVLQHQPARLANLN